MTIAIDPKSGAAVYLNEGGEWVPAKTARNPKTNEISAFDGKTWTPVVPASRTFSQLGGDVGRSLAQGMTLGFADEIAAGADTLFGTGAGKPTYAENLEAQQARDQEIPAGIKVPGEIAGSAATAPIAAGAVASGAARVPAWLRYAGTGAIGGGLYGAGEAKPGERLEGAGMGAATGLGVGLVAPPVVGGVSRLAREFQGAVQPKANVAADLGRAVQRDQTTPQGLMADTQDLQAIRPGVATVADAGGENVRGLVERIAQTPGAGRTKVIPFLTERQQGQMARISNDLKELTGTHRTATQAIGETMEQRAKDAKPVYDEAFNFNALEVPEIVRAWQLETSTGFGRMFMLRPEFRRTLQTEYSIKDPELAPLMVQIDAWKKVADDFIGENLGSNKARVVQAMRKRVLDVVDEFNPKYAEARNVWAGPSQYLKAIEEGRNVLGTKIDSEGLTAALGAMNDAEREAYRIGAVSSIIGKMGNDPAKMADMTKYLRSPETRAKIAALMPTPEARSAWQQRLDFEVSASELTGRALGNSATARRLAERQDADSIVGDLVMDAFSGAPPVSLLRRAIGAIPKKMRDTLRSRSDDILADLLTDPNSLQGLVKAMERVEARSGPPSVAARARAIGGANAAFIGD